MRRALAAALICLCAAPVAAFELGESEFKFVSELANEGFMPFAASGQSGAAFGMQRGVDMYLCFVADQSDDQGRRQRTLLAELAGENPDRIVPNLSVICILTQ